MKSCLNCGTEVWEHASKCDECGREFAYASAAHADGVPSAQMAATRPDGTGAQSTGMILGLLGVLLVGISALMGTTEYSWGGDIDPDKIALKASLSLIGSGLLQIGLVVWLAGYIVRAISFLPGRDS